MRRRRSSALFVLVVVMLLGVGRAARAQSGVVVEGAPEFILPTGARSLGMGQAVVALAIGSDGLWWNPAVISRGPRELALHVAKSAAGTTEADAAGALVIPITRLGAVALSFRYLNLGEQEATSDPSGQTGTFVNTSLVVGATFAAPFGDRLAAGVTIKLLSLNSSCTGSCDTPLARPTTGALDLGGQYFLTGDSLVTIGAAVRNVGLKLQVNDAPQADALPSRADVGLAFAPKFAQMPKELRVRAAVDVVTRLSGVGGPGYRFGGELSWLERYQARIGYVIDGPTGTGSDFTFGVGLRTGKLQIDFAEAVNNASSQSGSPPTYLTLRYIF